MNVSNEIKREATLSILKNVPILTTEQIAKYFWNENTQPEKRASENLLILENSGFVEGKRRAIGESKVWRLTKKGREFVGVPYRPVPLNTRKLEHWLALADAYLKLRRTGVMKLFVPEIRETFTVNEKEYTYSPDALLVFNNRVFVLEIQLSPLPSRRWAQKWEIHKKFYDGNFHHGANFQNYRSDTMKQAGIYMKPETVVLAERQEKETIQADHTFPVTVIRNIEDLKNFPA